MSLEGRSMAKKKAAKKAEKKAEKKETSSGCCR